MKNVTVQSFKTNNIEQNLLSKFAPGNFDGDTAGITGWTSGGFTGYALGGDVTGAAWIQHK